MSVWKCSCHCKHVSHHEGTWHPFCVEIPQDDAVTISEAGFPGRFTLCRPCSREHLEINRGPIQKIGADEFGFPKVL